MKREFPVPPERLWELLSNSDHMNRAIGLPPFTFTSPAPGNGLTRVAKTRYLGFTFRWTEHPFDWVVNERYAVLREFESGPIQRVCGGAEFQPSPRGTRLKIFADGVGRGLWGRVFVSIFVRKSIRDVARYCEKFIKLAPTDPVSPLPRVGKSRVSQSALENAMTKLIATECATPLSFARFERHLVEASDDLVLQMRPYALADAWGVDRDEVLRMFLYATQGGLLELDWALMCPNCRVPKVTYRSLRELDSRFHCDLCGVVYEADMDRYTELRFSVNPEVRPAQHALYCIGSPAITPHILAQQTLLPHEERAVIVPLKNEPFRVRTLRLNQTLNLNPQLSTPPPCVLTYKKEGWQPAALNFTPGQVTLKICNATDEPVVAAIEKVDWDDLAVTAARVTVMQEFRHLFGSEVLAPGKQIGVRNLCALFTDLKRSTYMYELIGDAPAFGRVQRHFDFLIERIQANRGGVVKTIGDAVMAIFPTPAEAVCAAMEIQAGVEDFNRKNNIDPPIVIKVGVHYGPAIAVNANDKLDYFGRTINIASRIQNESRGDDIVMTREMFQEPEVLAALKSFSFDWTTYEVALKDIEGTFQLCRVVPKPSDKQNS